MSVHTAIISGSRVYPVKVSCAPGPLTPLWIKGGHLKEAEVRELCLRVQMAMGLSEALPLEVVIDAPKIQDTIAAYDFPVALAMMIALEKVPLPTDRLFAMGELSFVGEVRSFRGAFPVARAIASGSLGDFDQVLFPRMDGCDAEALAGGVSLDRLVLPCTLDEVADYLRGRNRMTVAAGSPVQLSSLSERTETQVRESKAFASNGSLGCTPGCGRILLIGPPGSGTIARQVGSLLPKMTRVESEEITATCSIAGFSPGGLIHHRLFRAPHHSITAERMFGSKTWPGEVSLAHNGVLFLDELTEFEPSVAQRVLRTKPHKLPWLSRPALIVAAVQGSGSQVAGARLSKLRPLFDTVFRVRGTELCDD